MTNPSLMMRSIQANVKAIKRQFVLKGAQGFIAFPFCFVFLMASLHLLPGTESANLE